MWNNPVGGKGPARRSALIEPEKMLRAETASPSQGRKKELNNGTRQSAITLSMLFSGGLGFLKRQDRDWKVTVVRSSMDKLVYQMLFPYLSIYIVALGATGTQLGMVNSIGMVVAACFALFTGGMIDRMGPKRIYLAGIALLGVAYLTYGMANHWVITIIAMAAYWLGFSTSGLSCSTICGNCLVNRDRATGMMICETVAAGLLGMAGPMIGTWIVTAFGGVSVQGIRPIFYAGFVITLVTFVIVLTEMSDRRWMKASRRGQSLIKDTAGVVRGRRELKKWLAITAMSQLPLGMVFPFTQVFAHSAKGANEYVLGAMVTGSALTSIVFAIPVGRLADRIGRKQTLYMTIPLFWISNVLLVFAPTPAFLIAAGVLQGFYFISGPVAAAIERELVSADQMGRWVGITRFSKMVLSACCAFLAGIIWDKVGPQYVFVVFLAIDVLIRMPMLISLPETLHTHHKS